MWLELASLPEDPPRPPGLEIALADDDGPFGVEGLPYDDPAELPALHAAARRRPRRFWRFAARLDGRVVGQSALHLTTGHLGIAGIFSVGVVPAARRQGIGSAVTLAACRQAQALGCHHAALNATPDGERLYRRLGFTSLGHGQTWWLDAPVLAAPPGADQVAFAEAIGWGDVAALAALASRLPSAAAQTPLANGMLPLDLAVTTRQPAAAEWLVSHGATLDLLSAWDLGWKERLPALLAADPALVGHRSGEASATPLHLAAQRGDLELARLLLAAGADLEARDSSYQSTPLGWAEYLGQQGIAALLRQHRNGEQP
jgi:GNAT superfamily N-acetyltransferase